MAFTLWPAHGLHPLVSCLTQDLTARYSRVLLFSLAVPPGPQEGEAEGLVRARLSPAARRVHRLNGAQTWELPKGDASLAAVFEAMLDVRRDGRSTDAGAGRGPGLQGPRRRPRPDPGMIPSGVVPGGENMQIVRACHMLRCLL